jgi:Asp-tRNA(Asn)/Glu-tRNA(Gln) amidotransferase A subunit family amidase
MPDLRERGQNGPHGAFNLLTVGEASERLAARTMTSVELVEDCLARIGSREPEVRAWAHVDRGAALAQARARDGEDRRSPLHGVPVGIKDIFDTYDMPTTYGSAIYQGYRPSADTAVVGLLRRAGAVILGKCVTTEFASPVPAGTRNPHDPARSPGVSSSGSAAAVADYMVPLAIGSQTGGSTILPASFCGVVGYKASLTGLDRGGIRHLRPTLDTMGLFARSVADIAIARAVLTGADGSSSVEPGAAGNKLRIGVCRSLVWNEAAPESRRAVESASERLAAAGAAVSDAEMGPVFEGIERSFRTISSVEGARALGIETRDHLARLNHYIQDAHASSRTIDQATYDRAQVHAIRCQRALADLFKRCDVLITPAACGEAVADLVSVSNSAFNRVWTLMHVPCVSIPAFTGPNGMPVGLQIVGPAGADDRTLALAQWIADRLG